MKHASGHSVIEAGHSPLPERSSEILKANTLKVPQVPIKTTNFRLLNILEIPPRRKKNQPKWSFFK